MQSSARAASVHVTASTRLGRIVTPGRRFIAEVDGLRFVAISAVVLHHLSGYTLAKHMAGAALRPADLPFSRLFGLGWFGVQLFFVLSGFLLALPFAKWRLGYAAKPSLAAYYLRRLTRLEPPYIVAALLLFIGAFAAARAEAGRALWPLLATLTYQHNLIFGEASRISAVFWSLEIEVQFYILAPYLSAVFNLKNTILRRAVVLCAMIALPLLRNFAWFCGADLTLPWHIEFFAAGFLLCDFYVATWNEKPRRSYAWDGASLLGWLALAVLLLWDRAPLLVPFCVLLAYVGAFRGQLSSRLLCRRLLTTVGGMCYSAYLLHFAIISITGRLSQYVLLGSSFLMRFLIDAAFAIPAILGVTTVYFVFLERPCMDPSWPRKIRDRMHCSFRGSNVAN